MSRKRKIWLLILSFFILAFTVLFNLWQSAIEKNRQIPVGPFQIAGNLYYVGTTDVTSFLITGDKGHILIDGAYPESAPMIIESVSELGFDISDVKILLNSHAHLDHAGGLAELKEASGAELWVSNADADVIEAGGKGDHSFGPLRFLQFLGIGRFPSAKVDKRFEDGAVVRLGSIELTAHLTPGHTPGCTSWAIPIRDGQRELLAVSIGSLTIMPFASLVEPETYRGISQDYLNSFDKLRSIPADIFLASHSSWFNLNSKLSKSKNSDDPVQPFIDREGYMKFIEREEEDFLYELSKQKEE